MVNTHHSERYADKTAEIRVDEAGPYIAIIDEMDSTDIHFGFSDADEAIRFANKLAEAALLYEKQHLASK